MGKLTIQSRLLEDFITSSQVSKSPLEIIQELAENSIDAKATNINISVLDEDFITISVEDNGVGIDNEDARLICEREHSSKEKNGRTLGYKGEALFSIRVVCAQVDIHSKSSGAKGFHLNLTGNKRTLSDGMPTHGTKIVVKDPFYNLPVRKLDWKKRRNTYASLILQCVKQMAMVFSIRFRLIFSWTAEFNFVSNLVNDTEERLQNILGARPSHCIKENIDGFNCECFIFENSPEIRYLFINNRFSKEGYRCLPRNYGHVLFVNACTSDQFESSSKGTSAGRSLIRPDDQLIFDWIENAVGYTEVLRVDNKSKTKVITTFDTHTPILCEIKPCRRIEHGSETLIASDLQQANIIGQFNNGFILCEFGDKLMIIDQHAADERIFYEAFKGLKIHSSTQKLVIPRKIEMEYEYMKAIEDQHKTLKEYGFEFQFSNGELYMTAAPLVSGTTFTETDLKQLLTIDETGRGSLDQFFATRACKNAVRICENLSDQTMSRIVRDLSKTSNPWACAHGRNSVGLYNV